jgi:hypothetical protein
LHVNVEKNNQLELLEQELGALRERGKKASVEEGRARQMFLQQLEEENANLKRKLRTAEQEHETEIQSIKKQYK